MTIQIIFDGLILQYDAAAARFCGVWFVDGIFTNRTVFRAVEEMFTNVTGSARQIVKVMKSKCVRRPQGAS